MSSVECLREFVNERLTATAEEIFRVFIKTIVEYEEEIDRQRRLLDIVWKPEIRLHRIELPQQHVSKEEEVLTDQQLCNQERNSSLDQDDPEPSQMKEEQEELCTSQEGEQLVLKQETDAFMLTATYEESDRSQYQTVCLNHDLTQGVTEEEPVVNISVKNFVVSEPNTDHQLLSNNSLVAESQDQKGGKHGDSGSTGDAESEPKKSKGNSNNLNNPTMSKKAKKSFKCNTCGKDFKFESHLQIHLRTHTGERPYCCEICGKDFSRRGHLKVHMRTHTGEKPFSCEICAKSFNQTSTLNTHIRTHTELPQHHVCKVEEVLADQQFCNQERNSSLDQEEPEPPQIKEEQEELCTSQEGEHLFLEQVDDTFMLTPTYEQSYHSQPEPNTDHQLHSDNSHVAESQDQKGDNHGDSGSTGDAEPKQEKSSSHSNNMYNPYLLEIYRNNHIGKKSSKCDTCGKDFQCKSKLQRHLSVHTGERPYSCITCGKTFSRTTELKTHIRIHTGEKLYTCKTCGKDFRTSSNRTSHMRTHTGEKPFSCEICAKRFNRTSTLNTHIRIHTGEKPYSCKTCGRDFLSSSSLSRHIRSHTGERPYCCEICGKDFSRCGHLKVHMRTHTGERPYSCKTCGIAFRHIDVLKKHVIRTHTGEKA